MRELSIVFHFVFEQFAAKSGIWLLLMCAILFFVRRKISRYRRTIRSLEIRGIMLCRKIKHHLISNSIIRDAPEQSLFETGHFVLMYWMLLTMFIA